MHSRTQRGASYHRGASALLRRNAFYIALLIAAIVVWLGSRYLRQSLYGGDVGRADVMALPTCLARLAALGVLPDETGTLSGAQPSTYMLQRHDVYARMAEDVEKKGLQLGGVITQGLTQRDLFHISVQPPELRHRRLAGRSSSVSIAPVLKPLDIPVRAMILPLLDTGVARQIGQAVSQFLVPAVPEGGIWLQDSNLFHATVFHASSHVKPVVADSSQVLEEHRQILSVTERTCPITAVLERVVLTSGGVLVACWQATQQGGEPALLREALAQALPNAPPKDAQMVKEPTMLHTTLARLLQAPALNVDTNGGAVAATDTQAVMQAVEHLSSMLCGLEATFGEVWFIEEQDLLALALQGRYIKHPAPLICPATQEEEGNKETRLP